MSDKCGHIPGLQAAMLALVLTIVSRDRSRQRPGPAAHERGIGWAASSAPGSRSAGDGALVSRPIQTVFYRLRWLRSGSSVKT